MYYGKIPASYYGAEIFLNKNIPIGSGLGGGSSNAATTLIVLNKLWNTQFTLQELASFSLKIGTDVPGFIIGKTAIIEGIGNILHPIKTQQKWYLVVYPNINMSTRYMFSHPLLMNYTSKKPLKTLLTSPFSNDFENIAKTKFTKIKELILMLSSYAPSRMTGTGSCIFSEFKNKESAQKIYSLLPKNMRGFITKSVNISPLHRILYKRQHLFLN